MKIHNATSNCVTIHINNLQLYITMSEEHPKGRNRCNYLLPAKLLYVTQVLLYYLHVFLTFVHPDTWGSQAIAD